MELLPAYVHRIVALVEIPFGVFEVVFSELFWDLHGMADSNTITIFFARS